MGNPIKYYKKALQTFAYSLNYLSDQNKAKAMFEEQNTEIMEKDILEWKNKMTEKEFYYEAGKASENILAKASKEDGCDGFNACVGGLISFEDFIGITDEDE